MPSEYKNETCGGCAWFSEFSGPSCTKQDCETNSAYGGGHGCDHFTPSIQCRQVLALEEIAAALKGGPHHTAVILVHDKGELLKVPS